MSPLVDQIPVVICNNRTVLRSPSIQELARCLGLNAHITAAEVRIVVIVGAGPAGSGGGGLRRIGRPGRSGD
jgi:thioredoxin reductase (NADPH)